MEEDDLSTYASLISSFLDFLTVAIHTILYERSIYPASSFLSARKYNYPVRQNRHPKVCQWILDAIAAVESEILKGTVDRVAVVIYSPSQHPLERFMFDVSKFPDVAPSEINTPIDRTASSREHRMSLKVDLEEQYRAAMSKLSVCGGLLKPVPPGSSFTIAIELKNMADPPVGHPQPWVPVPPTLQNKKSHKKYDENPDAKVGTELGGLRTTPLRSVEAAELLFEMWIEEGRKDYGLDESHVGSGSSSLRL